MARKTKAVKQEPQVDVGAEIFASLRELEKVKGIPVEYMVDRLKQALTNAYRRDREDHKDLPADNVVVNLDEHGLSIHLVKTAVEQENLEDLALEIPLDAARRYKPDAQPGDPVSIPVDYQKFGRIAAQTAKQVVIQGIREAERGVTYESYSSKAQELMTGTVSRIDSLTVNGAALRTGDLYASGTVSGPGRDQRGSFIELSWGGSEPVALADGSTRTFLEDGDVVTISATAPGTGGGRISLGEVTGRVDPAAS